MFSRQIMTPRFGPRKRRAVDGKSKQTIWSSGIGMRPSYRVWYREARKVIGTSFSQLYKSNMSPRGPGSQETLLCSCASVGTKIYARLCFRVALNKSFSLSETASRLRFEIGLQPTPLRTRKPFNRTDCTVYLNITVL